MEQSLKHKTLYAILWNAMQRYGSLLIAFITNIILARILGPNDFGVIGILTVFIAVATSITESGFNSALIQRQEVKQIDYCTIFYWNLAISILLVIIIIIFSNHIGYYFKTQSLGKYLRVQSIVLIINAICMVQTTRLMKFLRFKVLAVRTILATLLGSIVGIFLALNGYGVWSLVWQQITISIAGAILLWSISDWRPSLMYSWASFRNMFSFGAYIFISSICFTIYTNLQSFIIGKAFSIKELGYYSQAKKLESVAVDGTGSVLNAVLFPVYATVAHDRTRHRNIVRKNINIITYLTFPIMAVLCLAAPLIIPILFSELWLPSVPMFQILCLMGLLSPLNMANVEIFRSIGNGKAFLWLQVIKRIIGICFILFFVQFGLYPMLWSIVAINFISYIINLYFTDKIFGYKYSDQLNDIFPNLILTGIVYLITYPVCELVKSNISIINLILVLSIYIAVYVLFSCIFKIKGLQTLKNILRK